VAGKGPDAQSLSRMDGVAVCLSQVQREARDQVATQNRHLTVPRDLSNVHDLLVEGRRAVEIPDAHDNRPHGPSRNVVGHAVTASSRASEPSSQGDAIAAPRVPRRPSSAPTNEGAVPSLAERAPRGPALADCWGGVEETRAPGPRRPIGCGSPRTSPPPAR